jgi:hypothetical protein
LHHWKLQGSSPAGRTLTIEEWVCLLIVKILPGPSIIKSVMLLATLDIKRKLQTTDIVITFVLISGVTMDKLVQIQI